MDGRNVRAHSYSWADTWLAFTTDMDDVALIVISAGCPPREPCTDTTDQRSGLPLRSGSADRLPGDLGVLRKGGAGGEIVLDTASNQTPMGRG